MYRDYEKALKCSYNTFVCSVNRYALIALRILFWIMRMHHADAHLIKLIDATDIPVNGYPTNAESGRTYSLGNFNHFAGNAQFLGGKTGYTDEARETMTAIFEVPVDGETALVPSASGGATGQATVAIIVLGSADRKKDVEKLLAWFKAAAVASQ